MTEYALYKGEDIIGIGTAKELAEKLGIKPETIRFYATPTQKRRAAAAKMNGMNYSTFMNGVNKAGINLNRKMLSEIAISDPAGFTAIAEKAKAAL
jgi:hypothetical protein